MKNESKEITTDTTEMQNEQNTVNNYMAANLTTKKKWTSV